MALYWLNFGEIKILITIIMTNNLWNDFKLKFFKSGSPVLFYIGINVLIFIGSAFVSVILFFAGKSALTANFINTYLAFPANADLWLSREKYYQIL